MLSFYKREFVSYVVTTHLQNNHTRESEWTSEWKTEYDIFFLCAILA